MTRTIYLSIATLFILSACENTPEASFVFQPERVEQDAGTEALFIGVAAVDENVVWLSGTGGTYSVTTDGGDTWRTSTVPGADSLQFRDVEAFDENRAHLLSIGPGTQSRIYSTADGGQSWTMDFQNELENGFFDCIDFFDDKIGLGFSDSIDEQFVLIRTEDGKNWTRIDPEGLPPALEGEGAFAASGTCLQVIDSNTAMVATGAASRPRLLVTRDRGQTWSVMDLPIVGGTGASGSTSISFFDSEVGMIVGGDIAAPDSFTTNVIVTMDGGETWTPATGQPETAGAFYGSSTVPGAPTHTLVAVGPGGADLTMDYGQTWTNIDTLNLWSTSFVDATNGWTVGMNGKVIKWSLFSPESEQD
ncbi:MAG: oxidoreductase [Rhodothermales bacterium]|nr:oxidoreductase [Rhodothermales bacterium]